MIALVDCNNFFASCERLFRPDLINKPVVVLSSNDGCVVARSNEVKALNIPMGVPYFKVKDIISKNKVKIFSSNFGLYSNISQRILMELEQLTPDLEVYSIDEAFLDLSNLPIKNYEQWGKDLKSRIQKNIGIPVSVGITPTKTLAKLASDWAKKHSGVCLLNPNIAQYQNILSNSEVIDIWGVGRQSSRKLRDMGVSNAWSLVQTEPGWSKTVLGINGERAYAELKGELIYPIETKRQPQKSMVASRSFGTSISELYQLENAVASFTSQAATRLRKYNQIAEIFGVFVRFKQDEDHAKYQALSAHMMPATNDTSELTEVAIKLTRQLFESGVKYKKAGVFAYQLSSADIEQTSLLDSKPSTLRERRKQLMKTIDQINSRFGSGTMQLASINPKLKSWHSRKELISPAYTTSWSQLPRVVG